MSIRTIWAYAACASGILTILNVTPTVAEDACAGPIRDLHNLGVYSFETNSRLEPAHTAHFKFGIVSCVRNTKTDVYDLYVNWLIPGPQGFVPPLEILSSLPRLVVDDKVAPLKGCLQYANRGDFTYGSFFGSKDDQRLADNETERGCHSAAATPVKGAENFLEKMFFKFRNFFPSDAKDPKNTMLQIDGSVRIDAGDEHSYRSVVEYQITPYKDSKGTVGEISIRPAFKGPAEALLPAFFSKNSERIKLRDEGAIAFEVTNIKNPALVYASYEVLDQRNQVVGAISFPAYVSRP